MGRGKGWMGGMYLVPGRSWDEPLSTMRDGCEMGSSKLKHRCIIPNWIPHM